MPIFTIFSHNFQLITIVELTSNKARNNAYYDTNLIIEEHLSQLQNFFQLLAAFDLIKPQKVLGNLLYTEEKEQINLERFIQMSINIKMAAKGTEPFLGILLLPMKKQVRLSEKILQQLAEWYSNIYRKTYQSSLTPGSRDSIVITPYINQYTYLQIGTEIFRSAMS
ncbi:29839_t:CDS:2 [Racocetra persica]|uniref:29839_t:CDS:1 n=1 Tax=Racocetra persica TaxID=160502 RepID=A0ACA9KID0_9GLOM|nr:29839_t:CDS:2 [Racocetra persica]